MLHFINTLAKVFYKQVAKGAVMAAKTKLAVVALAVLITGLFSFVAVPAQAKDITLFMTSGPGNFTAFDNTGSADYKVPDGNTPWLYAQLTHAADLLTGNWWYSSDKSGTILNFESQGATGNVTNSFFNYVQNGIDLWISRVDGGNSGDKQWHIHDMELNDSNKQTHVINYDIVYDSTVPPNNIVPEPISTALFLLGGSALGLRKLRRRK